MHLTDRALTNRGRRVPKCLAVSCSKNEGDFIESFIRYNATIIDCFCIVDESTDDTRQILASLIQEGFNINVLENKSGYYDQAKIYNLVAKRYAVDFDFVFYLDVDEILVCNDLELWGKMYSHYADLAQRMYWIPHAPPSPERVQKPGLLVPDFCVVKSPKPIQKVFMSSDLALRFDIATGAHHVIGGRNSAGKPLLLKEAQSCFGLAHFPVRSVEQFLLKIFKAYHWLSSKKHKDDPAEGHHVIQIYEALREREFRLSIEDLQFFAATYGTDDLGSSDEPVGSNLSTSLFAPIELKYTCISDHKPFFALMVDADRHLLRLKGE